MTKNILEVPAAEKPLGLTGEFQGFTVGELYEAFEAVRDPDDWRSPIFKVIHKDDLEVSIAAIRFYTATEPEVRWLWTPDDRKWEIKSVGYRNGPAGP